MASGVKNGKKKVAPPPRPVVTTPHFDFEREAFANGHRWVAGVDESGGARWPARSAWLPSSSIPTICQTGLTIRRFFSRPRVNLYAKSSSPRRSAFPSCSPAVEEIDVFNIRGASLRAMARAIAALSLRPHLALIDGRDLPEGLICPGRPIIDGDALSMSIAAASIVAKTMRDALMRNLGLEYPQYGFAEHVGYATVGHRRALASAGPCPYHRRSFRLEPRGE